MAAAPRTAAIIASASSSIPAYARTAGRAVHIKIHPRPLNVAESRLVLRTLEGFGEVSMFKHLKHDPDIRAPNTALAIFSAPQAASRAIAASPLQCTVTRFEEPGLETSPNHAQNTAQSSSLLQEDEDEDENEEEAHQQQNPSNTTTISTPNTLTLNLNLHIHPSTQNHTAAISRQHYTNSFTLETRSIMGQDLADRVPVPGYADLRWRVREVPLRVRNVKAEEERREGRGWWKRGLGDIWREGEERRRREREGKRGVEGEGVKEGG